jgi:hypothetical protein
MNPFSKAAKEILAMDQDELTELFERNSETKPDPFIVFTAQSFTESVPQSHE